MTAPTTETSRKEEKFLAMKGRGSGRYISVGGMAIEDAVKRRPIRNRYFSYHSSINRARVTEELDQWQRAALLDAVLISMQDSMSRLEDQLRRSETEVTSLEAMLRAMDDGCGPVVANISRVRYISVHDFLDLSTWGRPGNLTDEMMRHLRESAQSMLPSCRQSVRHIRTDIDRIRKDIDRGIDWMEVSRETVVTITMAVI